MAAFVDDPGVPRCTKKAQLGQIYRLRIKDLSPTQFATGKAEVLTKAGRMRKKFGHSSKKLRDYLRVRPVPVVLHKGHYYLVDHHHLVRALHEALSEKVGDGLTTYVKVLANVNDISTVYFWKQMFNANWVYLFDHSGGGPQRPADLPKHVKDLGFDPYRSLAWLVCTRHGYLKTGAPFSEFKWANFFRTHILLDEDIIAGRHTFDDFAFEVDEHGNLNVNADAQEIIDEAMYLAASAEARGLPGYRGGL